MECMMALVYQWDWYWEKDAWTSVLLRSYGPYQYLDNDDRLD